MIYLNEADVNKIGINWNEVVDVIEEAVKDLGRKDFAQPVKPYLRYRDLKNRIIAMPAFIGGDFDVAGIKWIASFPDNINNGIPRAHSVMILNEANTGRPMAVINTALLSIIRTSAVTGLMIRYFDKVRPLEKVNVGMTGWGPIGQHHYKMCMEMFGDKIDTFYLYDLREVNLDGMDLPGKEKIVVTDSWQEAYKPAHVFMTCTVSKAPYIDIQPPKGSLQLNVSLRDYSTAIFDHVKDAVIVDDWEEVNREKTDVEMMHLDKGLQEEDTKSIVDMVTGNCMEHYAPDQPIMFNPMGMAVFDMAVAAYYIKKAKENNVGQELE